jgi:hypothetical protein
MNNLYNLVIFRHHILVFFACFNAWFGLWAQWEARVTGKEVAVRCIESFLTTIDVWAVDQFNEYAAKTPYIYSLLIVLISQDNLRWAIPPWDYAVRQVPFQLTVVFDVANQMTRNLLFKVVRPWLLYVLLRHKIPPLIFELLPVLFFLRHSPWEPEVTDFDATFKIDQKVSWL